MSARPYILFFNEIDKHDIPSVGGKGANLGEMTKAGFPVPSGFAITVASFEDFLEKNNFTQTIYNLLKPIDPKDPNQLQAVSDKIQRLVKTGSIPDDLKHEIVKAYQKLSGRFSKALVAARSSATAEDLPSASFAGQQATLLNIKGEANLLEAVKECWASLYMPRAIFYRAENKIAINKVGISVIVQKMIQSEVSGVMFTINPVTNEKDRIVIESVWGLGEMIVQGSVVPDHYVVQKETFSILSKEVSDQNIELIRIGTKTKEIGVPKSKMGVQKISDQHIVALARLADKLQKHYFFPQDIEWAMEKNTLYIVQTRPVTTINATQKVHDEIDKTDASDKSEGLESALTPILSGSPASPGIGKGIVKILKSPKEISKVQVGDILVAPMTSPDYVPAMKKAEAIITDEGGPTSHAAIVSRELGIPCVVGTQQATKILKDGQVVTVDGSKGQVFLGGDVKIEARKQVVYDKNLKTATKVYVNLAEPELAHSIAKQNVDGVGLLRAEFMMANIGIHPKEVIKLKKQDWYIKKLASDISTFCDAFSPRPVVYRATDFKTNEYRSLTGGRSYEPVESNPMLGFRGAYRYIASPEVFTLELRALKQVQSRHKNLRLMIPFARSPEELSKVRRLVVSEGLFEVPEFKFWMMVEIPINVILLDDFIKVGIDGVSIGSNDLTMLITGTDRDNADVSRAFDERSPAVFWALKKTITTCNKYGITSSICGQAPSIYDDYAEKLVNFGVTSISVNPDSIDRVRMLIHDAEKKILK